MEENTHFLGTFSKKIHMHYLIFLFLVPCLVYAQSSESPQQIQKELSSAQDQYERAKKMFNPWYTGPLVTPASSMMPPGSGNIQPYLFMNGTYANFNSKRQSVSLSHNAYSAQVTSGVFFGITDSVDCVINPSSTVNWQDNHSGGGFNDLGITLGFLVTPQTLYIPGMKFTIGETLPTGKYKNLSTNGLNLNATGEGAYQTQFGFATGKVIWWTYPHPLHLRLFLGYTIESSVDVEGFNAYGGGFGAKGTVCPGKTLTADLGIEVSLSQSWVFALDIVYANQEKTRFLGAPGFLADGSLSSVGSGSNDNLSLAPAFEYNWNENLGIIWGVQFSVYGRNSANFVKGEFSVTYTW